MNDRKAIPEENFNYYYNRTLNNQVVEHIELPANFVQKYHYLNINNPSFYDVYLYSANPDEITFIKPFAIVKQNTLQSVEIPTDISTNGIFLYPIYNVNNSVQYSKQFIISFSTKSNYWNTEAKENNNMNIKKYSANSTTLEWIEENNYKITDGGNPIISFTDIYRDSGENIKCMISFYIDGDIPPSLELQDTNSTSLLSPIEKGYNYTFFNIDQNINDIYVINNEGDPFNIEFKNFKILII